MPCPKLAVLCTNGWQQINVHDFGCNVPSKKTGADSHVVMENQPVDFYIASDKI